MSGISPDTRRIGLPFQVEIRHRSAVGLRIAVLLSLLLSLAACSSFAQPEGIMDISCETLTANGLADVMLETKTQPQLARLIAGAFDLTPSGYPYTAQADGSNEHSFFTYQWRVAQTGFDAILTDEVLTYVRMMFDNRSAQPALGRVIDCLGAPDYYSIAYSKFPHVLTPQFFMDFYYTDQGIYFHAEPEAPRLTTSDDLTLLAQPATATTPIWWIEWVAPGDVRELDWQTSNPFGPYTDRYGEIVGKEEFWQMRSELYEDVQPWPGSIEQLQVTWIAPFLLPLPPTPSPSSPAPATPQ